MVSPPTRSPSRLVARRRRRRAAPQQVLGDLGGRRDHVLAVVEHDQQLAVADQLGQPARVGQVERGRDRGADAGGIADGRQLDQAPAERQAGRLGAGHLQREPRLAHPARARRA